MSKKKSNGSVTLLVLKEARFFVTLCNVRDLGPFIH